ncbi:oxidoreductase [Siminovitchia fortis]|uniref:Oxidoreductase n=1 Tax=Siminovitchia fortis TaxID=254758 RepID=A0A443IM46_9BACI|nr:oxidoreductase [Siminovitchia fortis]RWR06540.1 oxidoreductase [Siminovitchia fortis]WHY80832.1 oxidoreductase [Siminovitchia fortis]
MKNFILGTAVTVMTGLIAGFIFYHSPSKLAEIQEPNVQEPPMEQPLYADEAVDYSLQNNEVNITFDKGKSWLTVPIEKENLFNGEYSGNQEKLMENSYVLTEKRTAFLYSEQDSIKILSSSDQGESWQESVVAEHYPPIRFRKINILNDHFGYVIISGDRTMSQEMSSVFLTHDGGNTWKEANHSNITRLVADGGFIDGQTGFLSFGILNPEQPELHVTQDGGASWSEAEIRIPKKYHKIFVIAETPFKEGNQLAMLVNQGPSGDYSGGKVKGKFLSRDGGKTWEFDGEVQSDE